MELAFFSDAAAGLPEAFAGYMQNFGVPHRSGERSERQRIKPTLAALAGFAAAGFAAAGFAAALAKENNTIL